MSFHIAQLNIARMKAPLDHPIMERFVAWLEPINTIADESPGSVWRLQTEAGDATGFRPFDDDRILVNLTVWESLDSLRSFVFESDHIRVMRERAGWFDRMEEASMVLWWVPPGHIPSVDEAKKHLEILREIGPSAEAFTFTNPYPPPE